MKKVKRTPAKDKAAKASAERGRAVGSSDRAESGASPQRREVVTPMKSIRDRGPKTNLEAAMSRLTELYDFAPIAYVSLNRVGRIEEINFAAATLLGKPRNALLGRVFATRVHHSDQKIFLRHLLFCRTREKQIETDLKLKGPGNEPIPVRLSSAPATSFVSDGAVLYQTVIFDLRERRAAEATLRKSEERFRRYFDLGLVGLAITTPEQLYLEVNEHLCQMLGYKREELLRKKWSDLTYPDDLEGSFFHLNRALAGEIESYNMDRRWIRKDGRIINTMICANAVRNEGGVAEYFITLVQDITERKQADQALRASERQYRTLFDLVPVAVYSCDAGGVIQQFNRQAAELWGGEPGQNGAKKKFCGSFKLFYPDGKFMRHEECPMARVLRGEKLQPADFEIIVARPDGERRDVVAHPQILFNDSGETLGAINCLYDITERKRAERALRETEEQSRAMLNQTTVGIGRSDLKGRLVFANDKLCQMLGYEAAELAGKSYGGITHPEDVEKTKKLFNRLARTSEPYELEKRYVRKDGSFFWATVSAAPISDAAGKPYGAVAAILDISARKQAEEELLEALDALREGEERFRLLVEGAREYAMFVLECDNRISYWSAGAERVFGWTAAEALGRAGDFIFTEEDRTQGVVAKELALARRRGSARDRREHLRKDGSRIWVNGAIHRLNDEKGNLRGYARIARDATEERNASMALQRAHDELEERVAQRTEELLAAYTELRNQMEERHRLEREILAVTERERARISQDLHDSLCQELAATAFLLKSRAKKVALACPLAAESLEEAARTVNANAGLARDLARGIHPFELESSGLIQALRELAGRTNNKVPCRFESPREIRGLEDGLAMNLYRIGQEAVLNALRHARPGAIEIKLRPQNGEVVLSVCDDGQAMPKDERTRGLGIHLMKYRANVSGGTLEIDSKDGRGTTVTCRIPLNGT
jgi:PAS domain S-box-containing protein